MKYQNNQLWSECQLVSIWNARRFWGLDAPRMGTKEYEKICKQFHCISGACLGLRKDPESFGIKRINGGRNLRWIKKNLPVEIGIYCHRGYHSVLIVDYKGDKLLLTNYARGRTHWIEWIKLKNRIVREHPRSFQKI